MNVLDFCGVGDIRTYLNEPFYIDGNICCSNGHILAWRHQNEIGTDDAPSEMKQRVREMMNIDHSKFKPVSFDLPVIEMRKCRVCEGTGKCTRSICEECDGDGEVELCNDYNCYCDECKSCDGDGQIISIGGDLCEECNGSGEVQKDKHIRLKLCDVIIQAKYAKLIHGDGLECFKHDEMLIFKKDGVTGIIVGCRE